MNKAKYNTFENLFIPITESKLGYRVECNTVTIWNQGSTNVTINTCMLLTPGQAYTMEAYPGEYNDTSYNIIFANDHAPGNRVVLCLKQYNNV